MHLTELLTASLCALAIAACGEANGTPSDLPPGDPAIGLERVATGLSFPLYLTAPPNDARLFVVEKGGRIRVIQGGAVAAEPFLDISSRVSSGSEQGLLGLAFYPDFATSGRFVVNYTDRDGNTVIATFRAAPGAARADASTESVLLQVEQPYSNHNGGQVAFGPDGFLYVGLGDGGSGGDPAGRGQNAGDLLGSLLRLDVRGPTGYTIPSDNPFRGVAGARGEIWSTGLRNPWRFSFDRTLGDLYIADVGQNSREEIDVVPAAGGVGAGRGANFGWNIMEGSECYRATTCNRSGLVLPAADYSHADGCSVSGGYVYRGSAVPALQGHYFYSDFCQGWVRSFRYENGAASDQREWEVLKPGGNVPSFGEDANGELYILDASGSVYRIVAR